LQSICNWGRQENGATLEFITCLRRNRIYSCPIEPFRGNRFNIIFHNASSIYYLHNHIINFLDNVKSEGRSRNLNQLLQNVQENCTINKHIIGCRTLGIFNKCSTTPMWKLLEDDNIHILDMNLHYQMLAEFIEKKRHQTLNIVKTL
jgi:hypothetical protein